MVRTWNSLVFGRVSGQPEKAARLAVRLVADQRSLWACGRKEQSS